MRLPAGPRIQFTAMAHRSLCLLAIAAAALSLGACAPQARNAPLPLVPRVRLWECHFRGNFVSRRVGGDSVGFASPQARNIKRQIPRVIVRLFQNAA